jgi:hypothetical protein
MTKLPSAYMTAVVRLPMSVFDAQSARPLDL